MALSKLIDGTSFIAGSSGTGTFVFGTARSSFLTLSQAVAAGLLYDGAPVSYLAQDSLSIPTQREWGQGTFSASGSGSVARTVVYRTVNAGVVGSGSPLNFSVPPVVSLTLLAEDLSLGAPTTSADLHFEVNPSTGNDGNPGTAGLPFLNIQRAVDVALSYNYQDSHIATIQLQDGTYNLTAPVFVGPVINGDFSRTFRIFGNFTTFSNVQVTLDPHDPFIFASPIQEWAVVGMQINSANGAAVLAYNASNVITDNIIFNVGDAAIEAVGNGTIVQASVWNNGASSFIKATARSFAFATQGGECDLFNSTITFQNSPAFSDGFFRVFEGGIGLIQNMTYVNGGTVTGPRYDIERNGIFNGDLTNLPGTLAGSFADNSSLLAPVLFSGTFFGFTQVAGAIPTATDVPAGCWVIVKDAGGGGVYLVANDGGTIKKVQLT